MVMTIAAIAIFGFYKDDLQHQVRDQYAGFYDWVEHNTAPDAVFHPTFNQPLHQHLPVIGRRTVLASQSFPFREDGVREHCRRMALGYGTLEQLSHVAGPDQIVRRTNFFRSLGPADMVRIADEIRLDYVVVEPDHRAQFADFRPCYEDASVAVYDIATLRKGPASSAAVFTLALQRTRPSAGYGSIRIALAPCQHGDHSCSHRRIAVNIPPRLRSSAEIRLLQPVNHVA